MACISEYQLEENFIEHLQKIGWVEVNVKDEASLLSNLKTQLETHNKTTFTDKEFNKILNHLDKGDVIEKVKILRRKMNLSRDDGTNIWIEFFDSKNWCRNQYQVTNQVKLNGKRKNRYDVTLLVNGLPLGQVELKAPGQDVYEAFKQINRYQRDTYPFCGGLFQYIQIFVISNGSVTKYFANNKKQSYKQIFSWSDEKNKIINKLTDFTDAFLEKCTFSKMIAKYVVIHETKKIAMILRPYQYYAVENITKHVKDTNRNGYIWHTTGSGKTLTSFKTAQNLVEFQDISKVLFVVDRTDLDSQTIREFNAFEEGSVDNTTNTGTLEKQLLNPSTKLIVTTIQKLNNVISRDRYKTKIEHLSNEKIVFIFDECHRSQFGETHSKIKQFFNNAQMFGFTGTPIMAENSIDKRTTSELFGERLHEYIITNAIQDQNVLRFGIEYIGDSRTYDEKDKSFYEHPDRIEEITNWIIDNHSKKTRNREFGSMMCVSSVDMAISYYEAFKRAKEEGRHNLNIASIFTYAANEESLEADGLIPETNFPGDSSLNTDKTPKRDKLVEIVDDYNKLFGTNESVLDGQGFYNYFREIADRIKKRDFEGFFKEDGIDILIVVNMFLTGFDAQTLNTLYVDKNLKYHGLIQAYSRTNRVLNENKSQGNIVCFRNLKNETDEALMLYANSNANESVATRSYEEYLKDYKNAIAALKGHTYSSDDVDNLLGEGADLLFVQNFKSVIKTRNAVSMFSEFKEESEDILTEEEFRNFKGKYYDLAMKYSSKREEEDNNPLCHIDFELELLQTDIVNVDYILNLIKNLNLNETTNMVVKEDKLLQAKNKIIKKLYENVELREKIPLVEEFLHFEHNRILQDSDLIEDYWYDFLSMKKQMSYDAIIIQEGFEREPFLRLISDLEFSGQDLIEDKLLQCLTYKPKVIFREQIFTRVRKQIFDILKNYSN